MLNPLISILIPCRNASIYLVECLASISMQSYKNYECIVVDDGSTDGSRQIVERWSENDNRFISIQNDGTGIISALRLAYRQSKGEYITRMDADDIMLTTKLEDLLMVCKGNTNSVAGGLVEYFSADTLGDGYYQYGQWINDNLRSVNPWSDVYRECVLPSPSWMCHRSTLDNLGAFDSDRYPEDYDLCLRMYAHGLNLLPTTSVVHRWRDYPSRTSRTDDHYADNRFLELKIDYFLAVDYRKTQRLALWGAGKKGKHLARLLIKRQIPFLWITDNKRKVGVNIYKQILTTRMQLEREKTSVIVAVAGDDQQTIIEFIQRSSMDHDYFRFC